MNKKLNHILIFSLSIIIILASVSILVSCSYESQEYMLGTKIGIKLEGRNSKRAYKEIIEYIDLMDKKFNPDVKDSDVYNINNAKANVNVQVSQETMFLLETAKELHVKTNGSFNIAIYNLVDLWKFTPGKLPPSRKADPPSDEQIASALLNCNFDDIVLIREKMEVVKLKDEVKIDLGAIAKGYIADRAKDIAIKYKTKGIIDIGGNLYLVGKEYRVGIKNPRQNEGELDYFAIAKISNQSIVTSGDYEKYYMSMDEKERYFHIIDPSTGHMSTSKMISCSIIGENSYLCDILATASIVLGEEKAKKLVESYGYSAVFIFENSENEFSYQIIGNIDFELKENKYAKR